MLRVPHQLLVDSAGTTAQVADAVTQARTTLEARADGLLGSGWKGDAAVVFADGMREWDAGAREVLAALSTMADLIARADAEFARTDAADAAAVRAAGAALGAAAAGPGHGPGAESVQSAPSGLNL